MRAQNYITVREYATLRVDEHNTNDTLDSANISYATYLSLLQLIESGRLEAIIGFNKIRLGSQVGYIETANGIGIEILPKVAEVDDAISLKESLGDLRAILQKMVKRLWQAQGKEFGTASLQSQNVPIHEWIFQQFLQELVSLIRRGLKRSYIQKQSNERFLKGRLNVKKQLEKPPGKESYFSIIYDEFSFNRLENRLIKTALESVVQSTTINATWYLARELSIKLQNISSISRAHRYLSKWEKSKLMVEYRAIYPWCDLILSCLNPFFQKGRQQGISLLFKMEKLFESYVAIAFQKKLKSKEISLKCQDKSHYLVKHSEQHLFQLQPDLIFTYQDDHKDSFTVIADTKWKRLNQGKAHFHISQQDLYQMLAYGYRYQAGNIYNARSDNIQCNNILLIYPYHSNFSEMPPPFILDDNEHSTLQIWALPFKLDIDDKKEGLIVAKKWIEQSSNLSYLLNMLKGVE